MVIELQAVDFKFWTVLDNFDWWSQWLKPHDKLLYLPAWLCTRGWKRWSHMWRVSSHLSTKPGCSFDTRPAGKRITEQFLVGHDNPLFWIYFENSKLSWTIILYHVTQKHTTSDLPLLWHDCCVSSSGAHSVICRTKHFEIHFKLF